MINAEQVRLLLTYDPDTGIMRRHKDGAELRSVGVNGYLRGRVAGELHYVHRLAFAWMTGAFPPHQVDHINRNRADNRWCNLRHANNKENAQNRSARSGSASGCLCVYPANGRWQVKLKVDGRNVVVGRFDDIEEAAAAAVAAKASLHPFGQGLRP